ncbi:c-type cytochrome [Actibacterium ureilyticum]|uniref:c-type cytochrome n=1 Tax=Actibacterium ureilyticum TaxID=1590614 RepID=UPI000BAAA3B2|nr:cytochrome c [Actibacterium ureilyticum]
MRPFPILVALLSWASAAAAEGALTGRQIYVANCATCHGLQAAGDGPMTAILSVDVPDLRGLSAANGGVFPMLDVIAIIDGRNKLSGHGGPMPIFGYALGGADQVLDGPDGSPVPVKGDILAIARWLETQQR